RIVGGPAEGQIHAKTRDQGRNDRAVARVADTLDMRLAPPADLDRLQTFLRPHPLAVNFVEQVVFAMEPLDVQVLNVGESVCHSPGDALVMAEDYPREARRSETGHVVPAADKMVLVPDRRKERWKVGIVG